MTYITHPDIAEYCGSHSTKESAFLKKIREDAYRFAPQADMCSDRLSGAMLRTLTALHKPKKILELGLFYGYATLCMAEGAPNADITCIEWDGRVIDSAKDFFDKHYCTNTITVIHADANEKLAEVLEQNQFDFIFIDADKKGYVNYVEQCSEHLQSGGVMVVDNTLWRGRVIDPENEKDSTVDESNKILMEDNRFENVLIPIRDGMHLAVRK